MAAVSEAGAAGADRFRPHFLAIEWDDMVDAWRLHAFPSDGRRPRATRRVSRVAFVDPAPALWATVAALSLPHVTDAL